MENSYFFHAKRTDNTNFSFFDASSFFAVEATGDSEFDLDPNASSITDLADDDDDYDDNDDAESSSCDVSDRSCVTEFNYNSHEKVEESNVNVVVVVDDDDDKQDQQELASDGFQGMNQKSCVSFDATNESMTEMEKNKLFWETCLAS